MNNGLKNPFKDLMFITGVLLTALSTLIFMLPEISDDFRSNSTDFGIFFFNYGFSITYFIVLMINSFYKYRWKIFHNHIEYTFIWLALCLISCFSLNRDISIFPDSVTWLRVYLVVACTTLSLAAFRYFFPRWLAHLYFVLLGLSFTLFLYYAVYLVPYYAIAFIGFWFLGLPLHSVVPLVILIYMLVFLSKSVQADKKLALSFAAGILLPLLFLGYTANRWSGIKDEINHAYNQTLLEDENKLPAWARVSRELEADWLTELYLKTDLVFSSGNGSENIFWADFGGGRFNEESKHDPLVVAASLFSGKGELSLEERVKILEAIYDSRHQAQERLWSGENLKTSNVISNVRIYPEYRLAYTEKILSIHNGGTKDRWRPQEEAIYTFHLPEGSAVTSLSLWINGKEEKGYLTTKGKADTAYKTIVGVESRDPSIIRWQEGNTVSVRVFPCTPEENRRFKIGVTSPLRKEGNRLLYENIWFDGPSGKGATETIKLDFTTKPQNLVLPFSFSNQLANSMEYEGDYSPYWEIRLDATKFYGTRFSFDSLSYRIEDYARTYGLFDARDIYLDINKSWTKEEFNTVWSAVKTKNVYIADARAWKVTEENKHEIFEQMNKFNFSVFPVFEISEPVKSLLITKGTSDSPNLSDLKGSQFSDALTSYLQKRSGLRLFSLGSTLSPYIKTLKELRVFNFDSGDAGTLANLIKEKKFIAGQETPDCVVLDMAGVKITQDSLPAEAKAPDHLLRIFAYNDVMKKVNTNYFTPDYVSPEIIAMAAKGYIVSPVSSLIVLETQKDYERFGIQKSENSLQNASMKSSGSVPEPHEWMLIALFAAVVLYLWKKPL